MSAIDTYLEEILSAVYGKDVRQAIHDGIQQCYDDSVNIDPTPTQNSPYAVSSGGVYDALSGKQDTLTIDSTPTENSTNPVQSGGVYTEITGLKEDLTSIEGDVTTAQGNITSLQSAMTTAETDIDNLETDVSAMNTATSDDVGKALVVESVTNGKATFTFGDTGGDTSELETLVNTMNNYGTSAVNDDVTDELVDDCYYITSGNVGTTVNLTTTESTYYDSMYFAVSEGDQIILTGRGGEGARLWCFTDSDYKILSNASVNTTLTEETITAPADGYLFINVRAENMYPKAIIKYSEPIVTLHDKIDTIDSSITSKAEASDVTTLQSDMATAQEDIDAVEADVSAITSATSDDVGKVLKVATVTDGEVTEWEYADVPDAVETESRLDMTTVFEESDSSPQLVDVSQYDWVVNGSNHEYRNVEIDFSQNGKYYINPWAYASAIAFKLYDSSDNLLTFNSGAGNNFEMGVRNVLERVDDTHVIRYVYASDEDYKNGVVQYTFEYEYSGTIAYAIIGALRTANTSEYYGITFDRATSVYIPYGYDLTYNEEMSEGTWDYFVNKNKFYDVPEGVLNPWMQRSYATTDNLLDDRKINWVLDGTRYKMKPDETIPVTGGSTIVISVYSWIKQIDSSGDTLVSEWVNKNTPYVLNDDTVALYIVIPSTSLPNGYEPVYLYYVDTLYPYDDVDRTPLPMTQINGYDISNNLYDQCIPEVDSNIVRMMKTFAVRELNHQRNAFRIGTFNVYVGNNSTNRATIKKMLETYGLDVCCFQESRGHTSGGVDYNLGDYLSRGWQFGYFNENTEANDSTRQIASALEIISSQEYTFESNTATTNTFLKCVIQLPNYKHCVDGDTTLSLYTYHGYVNDADIRLAEVAEILAVIAEDTSDFIVVTGDTNDFTESKDVWEAFRTAGLTPVHEGISATVTNATMVRASNSLDNIFISSNITCLYYDVVMSKNWKYTVNGSEIAVSDHDMVYADLQFDFDSVIASRRSS